MVDEDIDHASNKAIFTGLFNWCVINPPTAITDGFDAADAVDNALRGANSPAVLMAGLSVTGNTLPRYIAFQYVNAWSYTTT